MIIYRLYVLVNGYSSPVHMEFMLRFSSVVNILTEHHMHYLLLGMYGITLFPIFPHDFISV